MAITITQTPKEGYKYIPTTQRGEAEPFTVWVKPLTSKELMVLEDGVVKREGETVFLSAGAFSFKVLQKTLVDWENINGADGQPLKIKRNADSTVSEETVSAMGSEIITEVANVVAAISRNSGNIQIFFPEDEEVVETPKKVKSKAADVEVA